MGGALAHVARARAAHVGRARVKPRAVPKKRSITKTRRHEGHESSVYKENFVSFVVFLRAFVMN
jgi:hypothetical protein